MRRKTLTFGDYAAASREDAQNGYVPSMLNCFKEMENLASKEPSMQKSLSDLKREIEPIAYRTAISKLIVESIRSGKESHGSNGTTKQLLEAAVGYASHMDDIGYSSGIEANVRNVVNGVNRYLCHLRNLYYRRIR